MTTLRILHPSPETNDFQRPLQQRIHGNAGRGVKDHGKKRRSPVSNISEVKGHSYKHRVLHPRHTMVRALSPVGGLLLLPEQAPSE